MFMLVLDYLDTREPNKKCENRPSMAMLGGMQTSISRGNQLQQKQSETVLAKVE